MRRPTLASLRPSTYTPGASRLPTASIPHSAAVPMIVLVALIIIFGVARGERFFSAYTLTLIMQQVAVVGILAAAQTLVILTAGIDLAIGVVMVLMLLVFSVIYIRRMIKQIDEAS